MKNYQLGDHSLFFVISTAERCGLMLSQLMPSAMHAFIVLQGDADDSDASSSNDDETSQNPQVVLSREDVYKAMHKGTKQKKKAKLRRIIRIMKRQHRRSLEKSGSNSYSPLTHLKNAKGFAEKLFHRLRTCNEQFEVKMMMLKVIARTVGLHCLSLSKFYPFLERYFQPHQHDVTNLLAEAIQACHDEARKEAKQAISQHGLLRRNSNSTSATFRIPSSEELSTKRLDPSKLEAHIKRKLSKDERLALVRAGREVRGQYQARAVVKQKNLFNFRPAVSATSRNNTRKSCLWLPRDTEQLALGKRKSSSGSVQRSSSREGKLGSEALHTRHSFILSR